MIEQKIPERIDRLDELADNFWWSWPRAVEINIGRDVYPGLYWFWD